MRFAGSCLVLGALVVSCGSGKTTQKTDGRLASVVLAEVETLVRGDAAIAGNLAPTAEGWLREDGLVTSAGYRAARTEARLDVGSVLPVRANGDWSIGVGQSAALTMNWAAVGARGVQVELDGGRALYRDAFPSTDAVVVSSPRYVEWLYVLRDATAPHRFAWDVKLPASLSRARTEAGGALVFEDDRGTARLRVPTPTAIDGAGKHHPVRLSFEGGRLTLSLERDDLTYPVVVDPVVETVVWQRKDTLEGRITRLAAIGSGTTARVVMFGGTTSNSKADDTWEYDGTSWNLKTPTTRPPRREWNTLTSFGNKVVMFGGQGTVASPWITNDTWEWDGTNWTEKVTATKPAARMAHMATNLGGKVVMFGGSGTSGYLNDTWEYNGTDWVQKTTTTSPPATGSAGFAALGTKAVLFTTARETWEYDGVNWTKRTPTTSPPAVEDPGFTTLGTKIVLVTGYASTWNHWEWDGTNWTQRTLSPLPPLRSYQAAATLGTRLVMFGGTYGGYFNDTWEYNGTSWSQKAINQAPRGRVRHAMAAVPSATTTRVLMFGGCFGSTGACTTQLDDTWEWDATKWIVKTPTSKPSARNSHAMATFGTKVVLFGGAAGTTALNDTWEWDGTNWAQRTPTTSPPAQRAYMAAAGGKLAAMLESNELWEWNGTTWTKSTVSPLPTSVAAMTSVGSKAVIYSYTSASDTWEWDGVAMTKRTPTPTVMAQRSMPAMAAIGSRALLFGGSSFGGLDETWEWNSTSWVKLAPLVRPAHRYAHAMASSAGTIVMFAGNDRNSCAGDTWHLTRTPLANGAACDDALDCTSGICADGVCCDTACTGLCQACTAALKGAGSDGTCGPIKAGSDPANECKDDGAATCLLNGLCDGAGACQKYPTASACTPSACTADTDCTSGFCTDGFCCDKRCNGPCEACSRAKKASGIDGVCEPVAAGTDPHDKCARDTTYPCKADGMCDGAGACRVNAPSGTACGATTCTGGVVSGSSCDGSGTCSSTPTMCAPYVCKDAISCATTCTSATDCATTHFCSGGVCIAKKANGESAATAVECTSGIAADGVCCDKACTGVCEACDLPTNKGSCTPVAGAAKHGECPAPPSGSDPCAKQSCDGTKGAECAAFAGPEVSCREAGCADGVETLAAKCDGKGVCPVASTRKCEPFVCAGTACATTCATNADCVMGLECDATTKQCVSGIRCDGDHTVTRPGQTPLDCAPYKCAGVECRKSCAVSTDCVGGFICDPNSGSCVQPTPPAAATEDSGGCSTGRSSSSGAITVLLGLLALLIRSRERGRATG